MSIPMSLNNELHGPDFFFRNQELLRREEDEPCSHPLRGRSLKLRISYSASRKIFAFHTNPFPFLFHGSSLLITTLRNIYSVHTLPLCLCYFYFATLILYSRPGSSVGITTGYGLEGPRIESRWGRDFLHVSTPALGPTQLPVQWVPGLSRG